MSVGYAQVADSSSSGYNYATGSNSNAYAASKGGQDPWGVGSISGDIITVDWNSDWKNASITDIQAKNATINIASGKMMNFKNVTTSIRLTDSFLNFADSASPDAHALAVSSQSGRLTANFIGGSGNKTINGITYNNVALYGGLIFNSTGSNTNQVNFSNGANLVGGIVSTAEANTSNATITFSGGGNLIATDQTHWVSNGGSNKQVNIQNQAVKMFIVVGSTSSQSSQTQNITFGAANKLEVVDNDDILDKNGVINAKLTNGKVTQVDAVVGSKIVITNMIRGNLYAQGYNASGSGVQKSIGTIKFYNNGLIDGNILVGSYGQFDISFAQNGKITGSVKATGTGANQINFNNTTSTSAEISSGVLALNSASNNVVAKNNLTIGTIANSEGIGNWSIYTHNDGGNQNTITVDHNLVVTSGIKSSYGTNTITAGALVIKANGIHTSYGTNTITANSLAIEAGRLYAVGNGSNAWAKNILVIANNTQVVGDIVSEQATSRNFITTGSINVSGQVFAQNGGTRNFIKIKGTENSLINTLKTNNGWNTISLENSGNLNIATTISTASSNARNYIAKGIASDNSSNGELALLSDYESNWSQTTYQASGTLTVGGDISAINGRNYINVTGFQANGGIATTSGQNNINANTLSVSGLIDADGGVNNLLAQQLNATDIRARWNGRNNIVITGVDASNFSGSITAGGSDLGNGNNYIYFNSSAIANFTNTSSLSAGNGVNYISFGNADSLANTVSISTISATGSGKNYLAKNILSNSNGALTTQNISANDWWASDDRAFTGTLSIDSVTSSGSGANFISYKATNSANSAIISNLITTDGSTTLGTAISGSNNNIYLNVSQSGLTSGVEAMKTNPTTLEQATVILGDIVSAGGTNIKIVGTPNEATSSTPSSKTITNKNQIGILGNINTTSGTANIVLQDTFFAPSAIIVDNPQQPGTGKITMPFGGANAGNITTDSGATTNVVTRFTKDMAPTGVSMYSVNGAGTTNIAIQGNIDVGTYINYSNGSHVNLIFANASDNNTDNFSNGTTNVANNQILGVTYQNGVKLSIADKTILIGDNNASFLDTYASYYTDGSTPLATVWANRTDTKDTVAISGLVVGNISNLIANDSITSKTYDVTLKSGSAFAGNINLNSSTTTAINIVMEENSKLILSDAEDGSSSNLFVISNLDIKSGAVDQYQLQTETLKQTNNVINIATGGAGANNVATREEFRLLAIGNTDASGTSTPSANTGLYGDGAAVFMTYVNTHANQDNATLGGVSSSGKTTGISTRAGSATDGQYGNLYSDRIIIANIGDNSKAQSGTYYMQFAVDADSKLNSVTYNASNDKNAGGGGTKTAGNIAVLTVVNTTDTNKAGITLKTQDVLQGFDRIGGDLIAVETDITGEAGTGKTGYTTYFINTLNTRGATEATQDVTASAFATNYDLYFANFNSLNKRMGELRDNDNSQGAWARIFNGSQSNDFTKSKSTYTTFQGGYDYAFGFEGANNYLGVALSYAMSSSKSDLNALDINGSTKGIDNIKSSAVEVALYNSYVQDEGWYNDTIAKFSYIFSDFTITGQESKYNTTNMAFTLSDEFGYRFKLGSEKEWYIDPQLEVALGYFNQSDFIQTLGLSSLEGVADGIITTRARFGSSFGYDFKKFTANKPIKASVYVGAFYEYDYITGGDVTLTTNLGGVTTSSSAVSSDGRVVMNVGTNMTIKDNTRIYFDFESSFAGKINTDYQVNVGVRYSFGENTGYTPMTAKREVAPLKVSEEKTEESKEVEKTESNTQEKSTENKTEENKAQ